MHQIHDYPSLSIWTSQGYPPILAGFYQACQLDLSERPSSTQVAVIADASL